MFQPPLKSGGFQISYCIFYNLVKKTVDTIGTRFEIDFIKCNVRGAESVTLCVIPTTENQWKCGAVS